MVKALGCEVGSALRCLIRDTVAQSASEGIIDEFTLAKIV